MYNSIELIGNVGSIEANEMSNGKVMTKFSVATKSGYFDKNKNERVEETTWHNCVNFKPGNTNYLGYVKVGALVFVRGEQQHRKVEKDGVTKYFAQVMVDEVIILKSAKQDKDQVTDDRPTPQAGDTPLSDDGIPF